MVTEQSVLETLRRVPDRIILAVVGRGLELEQNDSCLCGWFVREKLAEIKNVGASEVAMPKGSTFWAASDRASDDLCVELFGGEEEEWEAIYHGVTDDRDMPVVEAAFVRRVDEAVNPPKRRARR